jgi:uncharacterized membrane protein
VKSLLSLVIVAWLPGAAVFRLPGLRPEQRAGLGAEERLFWSVVLSVAISLTAVLSLAALGRYSFGRLLIADTALALVAVAASWRGPRVHAGGPGPAALLPIALAIVAAVRFSPPSEYIIGGKDPGVYVNAGVQIAQRGTLTYHDPVVAAVPPFARDLFLPQDVNRPGFVAPRFMGFYILDPDRGTVVSQFPHLFPASIAIGYGAAGLTGARWTMPIWAVLGIVAIYLLAARLAGRLAAVAATGLLTLHVVQVWFARYPSAEMPMQALLFASLLANARAQIDGDDFFAPVSGALLGLMFFLRVDAIVPLAGIVAALALGVVVGRRVRWTFIAPIVVAGGLLVPYATGPLREYFARLILFVENLHAIQYALAAAAVTLLSIVIVVGRRIPAVARSVERWTPTLVVVTLLVAAIYAYAFRQPVHGQLADYDAYSLRTFVAFYLLLPAFVAALIGLILTRDLFWRDPGFFLAFAATCLFTFYKARIVPEHFWAARRFVPIILPGAMLLIAAVAVRAPRGRSTATRAASVMIGAVFLAVLAAAYARMARPVTSHVEYGGIIARLEQLAGRVGDDDLLVVESRDAGSDVHVLALPLAYIYARNVLVLSTAAPDKTTFAAFLDRMRARYSRVLFLGGGGTDLLSSRWSVTPIAGERFGVPEWESAWNAFPRAERRKDFEYSLYQFGPPRPPASETTLDVGINDDLNVIRFHAKETTEGRTIRWSQRQSFLILDHVAAADRTLAMWMSDGGRPEAAPPAVVRVSIGARELGAVRVTHGFAEYDLGIPADVAAAAAASGEPVWVTLRTETWNPLRTLGAPDNRDLGVMVDRVAVR